MTHIINYQLLSSDDAAGNDTDIALPVVS